MTEVMPPVASEAWLQERQLNAPASVEYLHGGNLLDPNGPITSYVRARLAVLCADEYEVPAAYVVQNEELNAYAVANTIVVNDGALEALDSTEAFDALLAHELGHVVRGHTCRAHERRTPSEEIGQVRTGELEADVFAMQLLDKRGINPQGVPAMLGHLREISEPPRAEGSEGKRRPRFYSPTHGSAADREVTLKQAFHVLDTRHISPTLTPMVRLAAEQPLGVDDASFAEQPPIVRQAVVNWAYQAPRLDAAQKALLRAEQGRILTELLPDYTDRDREIVQALADRQLSKLDAGLQEVLPVIANEQLGSILGRWRYLGEVQSYVQNALSRAVNSQMPLAEARPTISALAEYGVLDRAFDVQVHVVDAIRTYGEIAAEKAVAALAELPAGSTEHDDLQLPVKSEQDHELAISIQKVFTKNDDRCLERLHERSPIDQLRFLTDNTIFGEPGNSEFRLSDNRTISIVADWFYWGSGIDRASYRTEKDVLRADDSIKEYYTFSRPHANDMRMRAHRNGISQRLLKSVEPLVSQPVPQLLRDLAALTRQDSSVDVAEMSLVLLALRDAVDPQNPDQLPLLLLSGAYDFYRDAMHWNGTAESALRELSQVDTISAQLHGLFPDTEVLDSMAILRREVRPASGMDRRTKLTTSLRDRAIGLLLGPNEDKGEDALLTLFDNGVLRIVNGADYELEEYDLPERMVGQWYRAVEKIITRPDVLQDEQALLTLAALGKCAPDLEIRLALPAAAIRQLAENGDFTSCLALVERFALHPDLRQEVLGVLIEQKATSAADFELLSDLVEQFWGDVTEQYSHEIGLGSVIDSVLLPEASARDGVWDRQVANQYDTIRGVQSQELLAALLSSGHDDTALKRYIADRWWAGYRTHQARNPLDGPSELREYFKVEDYMVYRGAGKAARLQHWLQHDYPNRGSYQTYTETVGNAFLATKPARYWAVRKLLLSNEDSVLKREGGRQELVEALMQSWLSIEDDEQRDFTKGLLLDVLLANEISDTYQFIGPVLQDMILKPAKQPAELRTITGRIATELHGRLIAAGRLKPQDTRTDFPALHRRIYGLFTGGSLELTVETPAELRIKSQALQLFGLDEQGEEAQSYSAIGFAALAGKKSGSLGVKMLQLANQYLELDEEDRRHFEGVYDDMVGQTRLQAYHTLKREAQYSAEARQLFESIAEYGPRVGGGSLFTVYKVKLHDGQDTVVGVKNPNADYRTAELAKFAHTGLDATLQRTPEDMNARTMQTLLADAAQWVYDELNDEQAAVAIPVFGRENDTRQGGFKKGNAAYELITPSTIATGSPWLRSEAFVAGKNLTSLEITDDGHTDIPAGRITRDDYQQATSLLIRNYIHQIISGSYAHSDVHPGNFRITADNQAVAIFDRNNLIPMTPQLRTTILGTVKDISKNNVAGAVARIAQYAGGQAVITPELSRTLQDLSVQYAGDIGTLMTRSIVALKREGISVPLELSLILRNFMSLSQFSEQAGFSDLRAAIAKTAKLPEQIKLWKYLS